eukprot:scaffold276863_cov37-Tisochrysis_lutea.AAC.2
MMLGARHLDHVVGAILVDAADRALVHASEALWQHRATIAGCLKLHPQAAHKILPLQRDRVCFTIQLGMEATPCHVISCDHSADTIQRGAGCNAMSDDFGIGLDCYRGRPVLEEQ